jgi:conjugal transfer/entry exclusion protein
MKELEELEKQIELAEKALEKVRKENTKLQDEVDSLWAMMDEIAQSDIENWTHLVKDLQKDVDEKSLMITTKVADC